MKALLLLMVMAPQDADLNQKLKETYTAAGDWLVGQQDASGAWKMGPPGQAAPSAALTGLIVTALGGAPDALRDRFKSPVEKATAFLLSKANQDGSFGEGPTGSFLKTYTTAVVLMGFSTLPADDKVAGAIRGAQAYLKQNQLKEGLNRGGSGYGDDEPAQGGMKKTIANLSATGFAAEGLKRSGLPQDDAFWKLVVEFVRKCQNNSEVNQDKEFAAALKEKGLAVGEDGGLYYAPVADPKVHKAGTVKLADKETIVSYGSMTYEGIKTYLYAGLPKDSPEVKSAIDWVRKNYTVEAHPGFAFDAQKRHHLRGVYYYYLVMARALDAYGENPFATIDGVKHDWARELGAQLLKSVKESKMWVNDNVAWFEGDPVMVTSYVLITCDLLFKNIR